MQFTVEDGGFITVDGTPYQLHYYDETHFSATSLDTPATRPTFFHICQFGEGVIGRGMEVKPAKPADGLAAGVKEKIEAAAWAKAREMIPGQPASMEAV